MRYLLHVLLNDTRLTRLRWGLVATAALLLLASLFYFSLSSKAHYLNQQDKALVRAGNQQLRAAHQRTVAADSARRRLRRQIQRDEQLLAESEQREQEINRSYDEKRLRLAATSLPELARFLTDWRPLQLTPAADTSRAGR